MTPKGGKATIELPRQPGKASFSIAELFGALGGLGGSIGVFVFVLDFLGALAPWRLGGYLLSVIGVYRRSSAVTVV